MGHWGAAETTMGGFCAQLHPGNAIEKRGRRCMPKRVTCAVATGGSCSATFVAMMQAADLWERNDLASIGRLYAAGFRTILV
jgi:hypothetical protein